MNFSLNKNLSFKSISEGMPSVDFTGSWENQLKSKMNLQVLTNGKISGTYITAVGSPQDFEEFELMGTATGDLISFTVNFGKYGSLTSWVGQHTIEEGNEKIATLWHLAKNFTDAEEEDKIWSAILAGADNFHRI